MYLKVLAKMLFVFLICFLISSSLAKFSPEDMKSITTINSAWPTYNTWYPIMDNTIRFSVHVGHNAWISLTSTAYHSAPKYEVLLGGDGNTKVKILKNRNLILAVTKTEVLDPETFKGFWIKIENRYSPNLKISVGRQGEYSSFIEIEDEGHIDINYMAIATTGSGHFGYWLLNGIDKSLGILGHINVTSATTLTQPTPIYKKFYRMTENFLRLFVKAPHFAHVILTPENETTPNYEIVFGTQGNEALEIRKNGDTLKTYFNNYILDSAKYMGFWISVTRNDINGVVIAVGRIDEIAAMVTYVDNYTPVFNVKYFSITTSDVTAAVGYWRLLL